MEKIDIEQVSSLFTPLNAEDLDFSDSLVQRYRRKRQLFWGTLVSLIVLAMGAVLLNQKRKTSR